MTTQPTPMIMAGRKIFLLRHDKVVFPDQHPSGLAGQELGGMILGQLDYPITHDHNQERYNRMANAITNNAPANNEDDIFFVGSDLIRVQQTFDRLMVAMKKNGRAGEWQLTTNKDFREQHLGKWQGMTYDQVEATDKTAYDFFWQDFINRPPPSAQTENQPAHEVAHEPENQPAHEIVQGESFIALYQRAVPRLQSILTARHEKTIVVVAHDGVLRALLAFFYQTMTLDSTPDSTPKPTATPDPIPEPTATPDPSALATAITRAMGHKLPNLSLLKIDYKILANPVIDFL